MAMKCLAPRWTPNMQTLDLAGCRSWIRSRNWNVAKSSSGTLNYASRSCYQRCGTDVRHRTQWTAEMLNTACGVKPWVVPSDFTSVPDLQSASQSGNTTSCKGRTYMVIGSAHKPTAGLEKEKFAGKDSRATAAEGRAWEGIEAEIFKFR